MWVQMQADGLFPLETEVMSLRCCVLERVPLPSHLCAELYGLGGTRDGLLLRVGAPADPLCPDWAHVLLPGSLPLLRRCSPLLLPGVLLTFTCVSKRVLGNRVCFVAMARTDLCLSELPLDPGAAPMPFPE